MGFIFSHEGCIRRVLVKISVCPDVVVLRGVTNNGKLGGFSWVYNAFDCRFIGALTTEIWGITRGLTFRSFARGLQLEERSSTCSLSIEKSSRRFILLFCKG